MKHFKIYGSNYELCSEPDGPVEEGVYGYKNELVYETPNCKFVGYVTMEDDTIVACYKKFNIALIIAPVLIAVFAVIVVIVYLLLQPKDVYIGGTPVKVGDDANSVSYNGFMALRDGSLTVDFHNGGMPCTIKVIGDGVASDEIKVDADEYVATVPATFDTDAAVINGKIQITTDTSDSEMDVVIEVPENNTPNSTENSMEGFWDGEYIYGD